METLDRDPRTATYMGESAGYDWLTLGSDEEIWSGQPAKEAMYGAYLVGVPLMLLAGTDS